MDSHAHAYGDVNSLQQALMRQQVMLQLMWSACSQMPRSVGRGRTGHDG